MRLRSIFLFLLFLFPAASIAQMESPPENSVFKITSSAFKEEGLIPVQYTCQGQDISPPLSWNGVPVKAKSFALIVEDPDAPGGLWVHWVVYNLSRSTTELKERLPPLATLPNNAGMQGMNDFKKVGYNGPCPPAGKHHRYFFKLYALDKELKLPEKLTRDQLLKAMNGSVVEETHLIGKYQRSR